MPRPIPMLDRVNVDGHRDSGALLVTATWLWTRFDEVHNAELAAAMIQSGCAPTDFDNLKLIDAALRVAAHTMFDDLYHWCRSATAVSHLRLCESMNPRADRTCS